MTILEALRSKANYPLSDDFFLSVLIERGLAGGGDFTTQVASSKGFRLCCADVYIAIVGSINIQEGGYSIGMTDKSNLLKLANAIYREHGEPEISDKVVPTAEFIGDQY